MKPSKLILIIILTLFFTIILARSCQDDYDVDNEVPDSTIMEQPLSTEKEQASIPSVEPIEPSVIDNSSDWPDSIYSTIANADFLTSEEKEVVIELNKSLVGHGGSDGSSPTSRAKRHNPKVRGVGENVAYGSFSARDVIISLVVDDDVADRGYRKNIFGNYSKVGVAFGYHKGYEIMCVQDFE